MKKVIILALCLLFTNASFAKRDVQTVSLECSENSQKSVDNLHAVYRVNLLRKSPISPIFAADIEGLDGEGNVIIDKEIRKNILVNKRRIKLHFGYCNGSDENCDKIGFNLSRDNKSDENSYRMKVSYIKNIFTDIFKRNSKVYTCAIVAE